MDRGKGHSGATKEDVKSCGGTGSTRTPGVKHHLRNADRWRPPESDGRVPGESVSAQPREMLLLNLGTNRGAKTWNKSTPGRNHAPPRSRLAQVCTGQL